jgi:hypothetical protein
MGPSWREGSARAGWRPRSRCPGRRGPGVVCGRPALEAGWGAAAPQLARSVAVSGGLALAVGAVMSSLYWCIGTMAKRSGLRASGL